MQFLNCKQRINDQDIVYVTFASVTLPYFENASLRLSSVVDQDRFPTKHRYSSSSAITGRINNHTQHMGR